MSYCRFSDNSFRCDVYCYASRYGGYVAHVARARRVGVPEQPDTETELFAYVEWLGKIDTYPLQNIGGPFDGSHRAFDTAAETAAWLIELKALGYLVPDYAIDALLEDAKEEREP